MAIQSLFGPSPAQVIEQRRKELTCQESRQVEPVKTAEQIKPTMQLHGVPKALSDLMAPN
jgi:hypothetical protein